MTNLRAMAKSLLLTSALAASLVLVACATNQNAASRSDRIGAALENAAANAGNAGESLAMLEQMYKRKSDDPQTTLKYAQALREAGRLTRANLILAPFGEDASCKDKNIKIEYASLKAAIGDYIAAEKAAREAVLLDPDSGQAYHLLGIALDAQGLHPQAEVALRKALDRWKGGDGAVLNNLGLNLAAQGFMDEAIESLRKAAAVSPDRTEIERNLRIVSALRTQPPKTGMRIVPKPPRRPPALDEKPKKQEKKQTMQDEKPEIVPVKPLEDAADKVSLAPATAPAVDKPTPLPDVSAPAEKLLKLND